MPKDIILILERDNFSKDILLIEKLLETLKELPYQIIFYKQPLGQLLDPKKKLAPLPRWLNIFIKCFILATKPYYWIRLLDYQPSKTSTEARCNELQSYITSLGTNANVILFSRSANGIISSKIADRLHTVTKLICLGYPFKHPEKIEEPYRFSHLTNLKTPFLIIQGKTDEYGGQEITSKYHLSPSISLLFANTNHDIIISDTEWKTISLHIKNFIRN